MSNTCTCNVLHWNICQNFKLHPIELEHPMCVLTLGCLQNAKVFALQRQQCRQCQVSSNTSGFLQTAELKMF